MPRQKKIGDGLGQDYDALLHGKAALDTSPGGDHEPINPEVVDYLEQHPYLLTYYDRLIEAGEIPNDALAGAINDYIADQEGPQPDYRGDAGAWTTEFPQNRSKSRPRYGDLSQLNHPVLRGKPGGLR
mgnify:CR=1 FL=1